MKITSKLAFVVFCCLILSACVTPRTYVDPQYRRASYEQIQRPSEPVSVRIDARFQRNGQAYPAVDAQLREIVVRTLRATGTFIPSADSLAVVHVVANNIADLAAARAKGFGTGLTLGAVGSTVDDSYEFTFSYRGDDGQEHESTYHHAIHTTVGNVATPPGATSTTPENAFEKVVEDVTLNFVQDLQSSESALEAREAS